VREALGEAAARSDVLDAATDADLRRIARQAAANTEYRVWCGSAGLAAQVPRALGLVTAGGRRERPPVARRVLVIAGSAHPATLGQVEQLAAAGWAHVPLDPRAAEDADGLQALGKRVAEALARDGAGVVLSLRPGDGGAAVVPEGGRLVIRPGGEGLLRPIVEAVGTLPSAAGVALILTGGETALHVCRALGARAVHVTGEALPGIPLGLLELPQGTIRIATKSGGFGEPDALLQTAARLLRRRRPSSREGRRSRPPVRQRAGKYATPSDADDGGGPTAPDRPSLEG
jgi:uncharacterized protein YgbK (DUF1537 family)